MAKRKSFNRRRNSSRKSIDSIGSGHLDPDTSIIDEEQTFWWNHLQENTFTPHSLIHSGNETSKQLSVNSRINSSQSPQQWWKNLDSDNEPVASTSKRHSAALVKRNIVVQTSTSESEKELNLRKKKVRLKANSRKSINNAFANALNDTEVTGPLKRMKRANYSNLHSDSNRKSLQRKSQEDEEDSNSSSTEKILKSKPSISRKKRSKSIEDQNAFQDILTEDNVLNNSTAKQCLKQCFVALEKESSKRLMHRNIDTSKDHINDQRKSIRASQIMPLENIGTGSLLSNVDKAMPGNNVNEVVQSSDENSVVDHQRLKFKSRFMQRTRKSVGNNAFADALADNASLSTSNPSKENSISPILQSLLSPLKKSINKSKIVDVMPENSSVRKSPRLSLNVAKKQQSDTMQAKDNAETNSSSSSLDNDFHNKGTKRSVFLKPKSRFLEHFRKRSSNPFEEIFKKSNVSSENNRASFERETTRLNQERKSLTIEEDPQSERNKTVSQEDSYEISLEVSSNVEKSGSKKFNNSENKNELLKNSDLKNISKSISQKNVTAKSSEERISSSRKSIREKTLKEHTRASAISPISRMSTNETVIQKDVSDDSHEINVEQDSSTSKSSSDKNIHLTRNNLRSRSETPKRANIEVHEDINNSHNDTNREHDSDMLKQLSKSNLGKEGHLMYNSLRTQSETLKSSNKNVEVSKRSTIADIEEDNNVNIDLEISSDDVHTITREHIHSKDNTNIRTHKNTILSIEMETIDDEDAESARQTIQQNFPSKPGTNSEAVNRQSMQSLNRTSIKDNREIARRQTSLSKPQNYRNTPIKSKGKDISPSKQSSFKTLTKINDFFKIKETSVKQLSERAQKSQVFDSEKMEEIKIEMEKIKSREMAVMKINSTDNKESALKIKNVKSVIPKQSTKKKPPTFTKVVNKAFLVNGKIYKPPRLPRPKNWATDRLYKFLWNRMEPKYKLATRVKSEKFVQDLAKIITIIEHRKNYESYKPELEALMKQMARLKIINTRADFYHFCQDFLPYEFRIKVIPMLLPGNKSNIPYNPENVHTPLLDTE